MDNTLAADVIIMGAGATGLAAAVSAAQNGAKVIVFEKEKSLGGTGNFFNGTFAVGSHFQREIFETYSTDQAFKAIMDYSHWLANPRLVRAIVDESADTIDWLKDAGVEFCCATINMPDNPRTYHVIKGAGAAAMKALAQKAKSLGVELHQETPVIEIMREAGRISGVAVDDNGEEREVEAPAVVIASGGFLNNKEWVKKYTGFKIGEDLMPMGNVDKMGDGIRMAWELGAAEEGVSVLEMFSVGPVAPNYGMMTQLELLSVQPDLWVDVKGRRFCDEAVTFFEPISGNANAKTLNGISFRIFDTNAIKRYMENGIDKNGDAQNLPGKKLTSLDTDLETALENLPDDVFGANSIGELAGKIGVDAEALCETVDEYNRFCAKGHDDLFAKDPRWLRPLAGAKFFAIKARTICLGTKGGIKINERMEAVDKKNWDPIPGLYAGGFDAGGLYGDSYVITGASGLSSAFALNSGKIAGRNAAAYSKLR